MKRINKILGIVLTVALLVSLVLIAAPAQAANPLQWNAEGIPGAGGNVVVAGASITDLAVCADGTTIYAATGLANTVYKSINGGATWSLLTPGAGILCDLIAVAPDNNNMVVVADQTTFECYVTTNGGNSWGALGLSVLVNLPTKIDDIDISAAAPDNKLAVAGIDTTGPTVGSVWTYNLGVGGTWVANAAPTGIVEALAVKFSPNFPADSTLVVADAAAANSYIEILDMSGPVPAWNTASFAGYPALIVADTSTAGYLALAPTYLGGDEVERVGFVSLNCATAANDGIYRLQDTNSTGIKLNFVPWTIAYDGSTLVAGMAASNTVWRSANPLETAPTFAPTAVTKSPGGSTTTNAVVAFAGTMVVAGETSAAAGESAFSVSTDGAASFNDISLIDTAITNIVDVAASADGSIFYIVTDDGADTSVWRHSSGWQRVLSLTASGLTYIVRLAPANASVVYIAKLGAPNVYYTKDAGVTKWYTRNGPGTIADLAVEGDSVAYTTCVAPPALVFKSANGGFTWNAGPPGDSKLGAAANSIAVISEGNVIVGGSNGKVSYSTDGNASWNLLTGTIGAGADLIDVTADGLASGSNIYATGSIALGIYRRTIGQAATDPWLAIDATAAGTGIVLMNGALYQSAAATQVVRSTSAFLPGTPPPFDAIPVGAFTFTDLPSALKASADSTGVKLWAVDTFPANDVLYSFVDTLVTVVPSLSTPMNAYKVPINSIGGAAYTVVYTFPAVAGVVGGPPAVGGAYELLISLDAAGNQAVYDDWGTNAAPAGTEGALNAGPPVISVAPGIAYNPGTTYYWKIKVRFPVSSGWSEVRSFTVESAPAVVPAISSPVNGGTVTNTMPSFSWAPVGGATKYQYQLTDDASFAATLVDTSLITTAYQSTIELTVGKTYFWRVKAIEPVEGDWSAVANFEVAAPAPTTAPQTNITVPNITIPPITVPPANVTVEAPTTTPTISAGLLWAVIIIGAVLVIALIVLIVRTRRTV